MPKRSRAQQIGDEGESLVANLIDRNPQWIARNQNKDYGIDLEAELATDLLDGQSIEGKIIKVQTKTKQNFPKTRSHVQVTLERDFLAYANQFRIPVILVAVCLDSGGIWWVWLQEWSMQHEARIARNPGAKTVTIPIPLEQALDTGLDHMLPAIARGGTINSMILSLREIVAAASGWEDRAIAEGVVKLLGEIHGPSRDWTLQKVIDRLIGLGANPPFWQAQQTLPILQSLIAIGGDTFTRDQVVRLISRGETYSRVGVLGLGELYDEWPDHAASLGLPAAFLRVGLAPVAWYAAMRERYPELGKRWFGLAVFDLRAPNLEFAGLKLDLTEEVRDHLMAKWPNRGDSVLLDCLIPAAEKA